LYCCCMILTSWQREKTMDAISSFKLANDMNPAENKVDRWLVFKPKIPIWLNLGGSCNWRCWYRYFMAIWNILRTFGIFYDHLVHLCSFGKFLRFWYHVTRKIWQPWSWIRPKPVLVGGNHRPENDLHKICVPKS
jgi:hypothetical protein